MYKEIELSLEAQLASEITLRLAKEQPLRIEEMYRTLRDRSDEPEFTVELARAQGFDPASYTGFELQTFYNELLYQLGYQVTQIKLRRSICPLNMRRLR